jgi:hypothetical protein
MRQSRSPVRALGPNATNRRAWLAGIAGGLLVLAGVIHYATGFGNSATKHRQASLTAYSSVQQQRLRYGEMNLGIAYGTTPKQVLRQIGSPTKKQANCWLYRGFGNVIGGRYSGGGIDAMKFCFSEGGAGNRVVTRIFNHTPAHTIIKKNPDTHKITKKHFEAQWGPAFILRKPPDWWVEENS